MCCVASIDSTIISPARSFAYLDVDQEKLDRLSWVIPEKWYSLTPNSAQSQSPVRPHREQPVAPLKATKPSENPYSTPPSLVNRFSDVSPNPKLIDDVSKHKHRASTSTVSVNSSCLVNSNGLMRKCHNPFNEGWKLKTFRPARERLVPYEAKVSKFYNDRDFGYLEYQRQVFCRTKMAVKIY